MDIKSIGTGLTIYSIIIAIIFIGLVIYFIWRGKNDKQD